MGGQHPLLGDIMDTPKPRKRRTGYMMAVVLGTALTAAGATSAGERSDTLRDLSRYCTACWRNAHLDPDCWQDCTQDVFQRLLERVSPEAWTRVLGDEGEEHREFLRAIDAVKKRTVRARGRYTTLGSPVADGRGVAERERMDDRAAVDHAATMLLSPRQQRILKRSFEGYSVQDLASELGVPAERVSDEKYKAIRKLRTHFQGAA
jgi:RNA polymerase sigma factor (sigma-70 family)